MDKSINPGKLAIKVLDDLATMSEAAIKTFISIAHESIEKKGQCNVALSGGKTPVDFYQKISQIKNDLAWNKIPIFLVDERYVPKNHKESNYKLIKENLCDHLSIGTQLFHSVPVEETSPHTAAENYEKEIKEFFMLKEGELPRFDLMILGIGEDGHTASLFPGDAGLLEKKHLAISVLNKMADKKDRITLTLPVINNAECIMFLANGIQKAEAVKRVLEDKDPTFPATLVQPTNGKLIFLIDQAAASLLMKHFL